MFSDKAKTPEYHHHIQDIIGLAQQMEKLLDNITYSQFIQDHDIVRSALYALTICGEASKKIPPEIIQKHQNVELHELPGLRDVLVHQYGTLDYKLIWQHAKYGLADVRKELMQHYPQCIPTQHTPTGGMGGLGT